MKITLSTNLKKLDKTCKRLLEDYFDCVFDSEMIGLLLGANGVTKIQIEVEEGDYNEEESPPED